MLGKFLRGLTKLAEEFGVAVVVTNQVSWRAVRSGLVTQLSTTADGFGGFAQLQSLHWSLPFFD